MPAPRATRLFGTYLALGPLLLASASTRADGALLVSTWSQDALEGVSQSLESPELRALRLAEEELFGAGPDELDRPFDPDCAYGVPDALSSEEPPANIDHEGGKRVDLSFLSDLKLPNLPVRWDRRVIEYLLFFRNDRRGRELAAAWLRRKERYGPMIRRVLAEHSLPSDLQYVAMIESGYDPVARSHQNAMGMWQFVKQPAEHFGLRVDHWADERLDPRRATEAAALYFRDLYDRFGSWELAFAGYNMGYAALLRSIRKYNTNDFWMLSHLEAGLPFETSLYVAKIIAMAIVSHNPERFGFGGLNLEPSIEVRRVEVPEGTLLRPIAAAAGVDLELLKNLNPHLKRGRVPPGEPLVGVYVPRESYEQFARRWSKGQQRQHVAHTVRFGETLEDVARRVSMSPARLRQLNELPQDAEVRAGFPLLVPADSSPSKGLSGEKPVAAVPEKTFRYPDRKQVFYRVATRDTPEAVARFFDVTVEELLAWNNLSAGTALQRDMLLQVFVRPDLDLSRAVVFTPDEVQILTVGSNEFFDFHEAQRGRVRVRYRVQPDDTLASIAERFELSTGSIGRINQFSSRKELKVDDWVIIYVPETQVAELEEKGLIARLGDGASRTDRPVTDRVADLTAEDEETPVLAQGDKEDAEAALAAEEAEPRADAETDLPSAPTPEDLLPAAKAPARGGPSPSGKTAP